MKSVTSFALLILVASMAFGGITNNAYAADDSEFLKLQNVHKNKSVIKFQMIPPIKLRDYLKREHNKLNH